MKKLIPILTLTLLLTGCNLNINIGQPPAEIEETNEVVIEEEVEIEEVIEEPTPADELILEEPKPDSLITSPLNIRGKVRGGWFFEGEIRVSLSDIEGNVIKDWYATAHGDWMHNDFVEFSSELTFEKPESVKKGVLKIMNNNPSDFRELDKVVEIPVVFEVEK